MYRIFFLLYIQYQVFIFVTFNTVYLSRSISLSIGIVLFYVLSIDGTTSTRLLGAMMVIISYIFAFIGCRKLNILVPVKHHHHWHSLSKDH
jgi:hypothetical protein